MSTYLSIEEKQNAFNATYASALTVILSVINRLNINFNGWINWVLGSIIVCIVLLISLFIFNCIDNDFLLDIKKTFLRKKGIVKK